MKVRLIIFLLVIFTVLLCSCEKNIETFEENNNGLFPEQKLTDNSENSENKLFSDDSGEIYPSITPRVIIDRTLELPHEFIPYVMELPYEYDGYCSMRFGEYFRLDGRKEWEGTGFDPKSPD